MGKSIHDRRSERRLSPWVTLVTHAVRLPGWKSAQDFHSLKQADYVAMFAVTAQGKIPLVRQYRSALERVTLEFPSGLRNAGKIRKPPPCASCLRKPGIVRAAR